MKSLTQIASGVINLKDLLETKYPDIHFDVDHGITILGGTTIAMWKELKEGKVRGIKVTFTRELRENADSDFVFLQIEEAVKKLRNSSKGQLEFKKRNNPTSRWFG